MIVLSNFIEKFYQFVDKIGKQNFILIVFILFVILLTGLYQTFSLFTSSEGMDIVDGVKTYHFILNNDINEDTITIPANSSRNIQVTISNPGDVSLKYGLYYSSSSDLTLVSLGYLIYSTYLPTGLISSKDSCEVSLKINNRSDNDISVKLGVAYGLENGGDLLLDTNSHWFSLYYSPLSDMPVGSYVKYVGNNGCSGKACEGQNANYVSEDNMGYCNYSEQKFKTKGWRIAYVEDGSAYLISAGSPECMCTGSDGTIGSCSSAETTTGLPKHMDNLNKTALKYCNSTYAYGGECNRSNTWNINDNDFKKLTGYALNDNLNKSGYYSSNDLIINGSAYWFTAPNGTELAYGWRPTYLDVDIYHSTYALGVRPITKLKSSIVVTGGSGTYADPYTIENKVLTPFKLSEADPGSYVKYTGNNGCSGKSCEGQNANYVSDSDMGYCSDSNYKFNKNGWRVAYSKDGTAYLTSGGAVECICTSSDGVAASACTSAESTSATPKHFTNLNSKSLAYCNSTYAYGGACNSSSAWNINDSDFQRITGDNLKPGYAKSGFYDKYSLINNGSSYWFATTGITASNYVFFWSDGGSISNCYTNNIRGVRPVLRLKSSIIVTGGSGTYSDPYTIAEKVTYPFKLSEADPGAYVKYTGNNGCSGKACEGQNANYVSDSDMGYCLYSVHKYNSNGWRVAYSKDGTSYLTSAGAPECMCTNSSGVAGTSCSDYETTYEVPKHLANLNTKALTYCNSTYAYGGVCNSSSAWNMNNSDFQNITGDDLKTGYSKSSGFYDSYSLINNGGNYWFATPYPASSAITFYWLPSNRSVDDDGFSDYAIGVRPVLRLRSSVKVVSGLGTYADPYVIE